MKTLLLPQEEIEMALAWLEGELTMNDIAAMRGKFNASNTLAWVGPRLREARRRGLIKVVRLPQALDNQPTGMV